MEKMAEATIFEGKQRCTHRDRAANRLASSSPRDHHVPNLGNYFISSGRKMTLDTQNEHPQ
ncbi:MAG: hypothetical protein A3I66_22695 [Burkholderiales bacterium RIFCSPLOWO2_02_FULL_57_36]|nr:MAG: hypothetical protein A3I66_22695 [Burkholderiales bacterium RIFCSPLOWO2_02_FULL_57_36]